jgi:5-hydroxyisourate hydrolase-like protein (transthyretin family)
MESTLFIFRALALSLLVAGAVAQAQITGTVTNKTTGKPAAGDHVALVDVRASMKEVAQTTTDARGRYSLAKPGSSSYLVRVTHQGATYFTAAPEGSEPGNMTVYDVASKVSGVAIDEDVLALVETGQGQLRVIERYSVHNSSAPLRTQWSPHSFSIVLPPEALVASAEAQRPSGLPTTLKLDSDGPQGHYSFNFPIQPDKGDKGTFFQIEYELPYNGKFTFHPQVSIPAKTVWVMVPKSMNFASGAGFQSAPQDPGFQTFVVQDAAPGKALEFTVSGDGALPRGDDNAQGGQQSNSNQDATGSSTSDPLSKYKGWILGALGLLLAGSAAFLLRKPTALNAALNTSAGTSQASSANSTALLNSLKEELFALESEKVAGTISSAEYAQQKAALETVLKRALKK